ncbi:hypothetical protein CLOM_g7215 [Closterium sp. NIES-68]|nr:hypothetical protein CLOM_g7215 [Closterium sp. NIES-68]GJP79027.1 hypothetical protein CLOP_g9278 [Closterium sp. NIES-67]
MALRAHLLQPPSPVSLTLTVLLLSITNTLISGGSLLPRVTASEVATSSAAVRGALPKATETVTPTSPQQLVSSEKLISPEAVTESFKLLSLREGNVDPVALLRQSKAAAVEAKRLALVTHREHEGMESNLRDAARKVEAEREKLQLATRRAKLFAARAREQQNVAEEMAAAAATATERAYANASPDAISAFEAAVAAKKASLRIAGTTAKKADKMAKRAEKREDALRLAIAYHSNLKPLVEKHVALVLNADAQGEEAASEFVNVWKEVKSRATNADVIKIMATDSGEGPPTPPRASADSPVIDGARAADVAVVLQRISASEAEEFVTKALQSEAVAVSNAAKSAAEEARIRAFETKKEAREKRQEQDNFEGEAMDAEFQAREAEKDVRQAKERAAQIAELVAEQRKVAEQVAAEREAARKRAYVRESEEAQQALDLATAVSEEGAKVLVEVTRKSRRAADKVSLREDHWRQCDAFRKETQELARNNKAVLEELERKAVQAEQAYSRVKEEARNADELVKKLKILAAKRHEESKQLRLQRWELVQTSTSH